MPLTLPAVTVRLLDPAEHARLLDAPGPLQGLPAAPDPSHSRILVAEADDQTIVGYWVLHDTVHAEPFYLTPEARDRPGVLRALLEAGLEQLAVHGVQSAFVLIAPEQTTVRGMAERLGFQQIDAVPFVLRLPGMEPVG